MQFRTNQDHFGAGCGVAARQESRRRYRGPVLAFLVVAGALAAAAYGNAQVYSDKSLHDPLLTAAPDANAQMVMREQQARDKNYTAANIERKKQIADDTAKLLKLASDLKSEVDKTTKDTLSLNVIRKADEIEKLAHDVKEKMKLSVVAN
jgi:hypothetical protein